MSVKYIHTSDIHNTRAAEEVVPYMLQKYLVRSVVDVGCGIGTWLKVFQENNVEVLGIDGDCVNRQLLLIADELFLVRDLNESFELEKKYDLVLCLEVAEHLDQNSAKTLVSSLTQLGDLILFSAAIPGQGGQNHLNEQFAEYWLDLFEASGYFLIDDLYSAFWNNVEIEWWYRQNFLLLKKKAPEEERIDLKSKIHRRLYENKLKEIEELKKANELLIQGNIASGLALRIFIKSVLNSIGIKRQSVDR